MHLVVQEPSSPSGINRPKAKGKIQHLKLEDNSIYNKQTRPPKSPHPNICCEEDKTDHWKLENVNSRDELRSDGSQANGLISRISTLTPLPTPVPPVPAIPAKDQVERIPSRGRMPLAPESSASGSTLRSSKSKKKSSPVIQSLKSTKVEYRRLGKSGLQVSVPCLGAMSFGDSRWQGFCKDEHEALPIFKAAYEAGLNTWDTANIYSNGVSEEIIGKALKTYEIPRHKVIIMTKCGGYVGQDPSDFTVPYKSELRGAKDYVNQGGSSRGAIFTQVEDSLRRLGTDYIDLLQLLRYDDKTPIEETMQALHDLVRMGKVRYIGASSMWCWQFSMMQHCAEKNGWTKFISMQNHYNLLYREEEREMNKYCRTTGVGIIPWSPLCRGHLARSPSEFGLTPRSEAEVGMDDIEFFKLGRSDADMAIIERVREIADNRGWKMSHVALAWLNHYVTSPIVGLNSLDRLEETLLATGKDLTSEERKYLEEPYQPRKVVGH